jgi:hypothetical protein
MRKCDRNSRQVSGARLASWCQKPEDLTDDIRRYPSSSGRPEVDESVVECTVFLI